MPKNRLVAVGAFVILTVLLFAVGLFYIGDRRMLFRDTFEVYAEFREIAGLQNGATVRVAGMNAGEVETIHLPASPSAPFRIKLRVREDLHPLIRLDSVASIQNDGLVGNKFIQIETGTDQSPSVPERGTIRSEEPFDLAEMFQRLNDTIDLITTSITDVKRGVDEALQAVSATATEAQALINDIGGDLRSVTVSSRKVAQDLQIIVADVRQGKGTVGKLVTDDALYKRATAISADAERTMANLREATENAKTAIAGLRGDKGPVRGVMGDLQTSLASARETLSDLASATEALKRNFFLRGFFNRRGFYDLDDLSVEEYRRGALERGNRRVLRVWVNANVLFETDATGVERLTDDGRRRLDSAMTPFLGYPPDTPLMVEGYGDGATRDVQFVLSRTRAQLVRDYVVVKFGLDPGYVGAMPLGPNAPESPSNGRWDGIALAAYVARTK
jgi:phospholipid/cholesterol/gamma-HCH transport system substrate-binding protein